MPKLAGIALSQLSDSSLALVAASGAGETGPTMWLARQTGPEGEWTGWQEFGQPGYGAPSIPAIMPRALDGRLEVFVVTSGEGAVWHRWQADQDPDKWSDWETLGQPGGQPAPGPVALALLSDGRVMALAAAGGKTWQAISAPEPEAQWSAWSSLGQPGLAAVLAVTATTEIYGGVAVVALTESDAGATSVGDLWHRRQIGTATDSWSDWEPLGQPGGQPAGIPLLTADIGGCLQLFTRTEGGRVWHKGQQDARDPDSWGPWQALIQPGYGFGDLTAFAVGSQLLLVATSAAGNNLWYSMQSDSDSSTFCPLSPLAAVPTASPQLGGALADPALAVDFAGRTQLFVIVPATGDLYQFSSTMPDDLPTAGRIRPHP